VALPNLARYLDHRPRRTAEPAAVAARQAVLPAGPSMRVLEAAIAIVALGTAVIIGLPR
jgi:hypothetical protein